MCVLLASTGSGYTGIYAVEHGQKMVKLEREQPTTKLMYWERYLTFFQKWLPWSVTMVWSLWQIEWTVWILGWCSYLDLSGNILQATCRIHFGFIFLPGLLGTALHVLSLSDITIFDGFVAIANRKDCLNTWMFVFW